MWEVWKRKHNMQEEIWMWQKKNKMRVCTYCLRAWVHYWLLWSDSRKQINVKCKNVFWLSFSGNRCPFAIFDNVFYFYTIDFYNVFVCFQGFIIFIAVFFSYYIILVTKKKQITLIKKLTKLIIIKKHLKSREWKYVNEHDVKSIRPIRMNPAHSMANP